MGFIADIFIANEDRKAQTKAADRASTASTQASDKSLALQRSMFDTLWGGTQVQRDAGDAATRMMASLMGLNMPAQQSAAQPQPAATQAYPTGQPGANVSYGGVVNNGRAPRNATERQVAAMGDGLVYDNESRNALSTGQVGRPVQVPAAAPPQPTNALTPAQSPTDWLRSTPGYQFNFDEGTRALNTKLAGQGRLQSGDASREAIRYGQNYGDRIYGDQWNRLAGIAGAGQTAQSQGQQAGQNYANNGQNALMWNGANQMQSSYNKGNASSGFWGNVSGSLNNAQNNALRFMGGF